MTDPLPQNASRHYRRRIVLSYIWDFLVVAVLFIPSIAAPWIRPYQRSFDANDKSIGNPYSQTDIIPSWLLPMICFGIPIIIVFTRMACEKFKRPRLLLAMLGILVAIAITDGITNLVKNLVGKLRPDFLARCMPTIDSAGNAVCTQPRKAFLEEGRRSFPSGHASTSFAGLGFAALFLAGQLSIFDGAAWAWKLTLSFCPLVLAAFVAISRVLDFRHHCIDVVVGGFLGLVVTIIVYHAYFPSPFQSVPDEPYTLRLDRLRQVDEVPPADAVCPC